MTEKTIQLNGKNVTIKKLPLRKYAEVLSAFQSLPKHLDLFKGKNENEIAAALPELIQVAYPDVIAVCVLITGLPKEEVENWGLDDLALAAETFFEVNNYSSVYQTLKKMTARPVQTPISLEQNSGSTEQ